MLNNLGLATLDQGNYAEARDYFQNALPRWRALNDEWGAAIALNNLGLAAMQQGEYAQAEPLFQESLTRLRASGNRQWFVAASLYNIGLIALYLGEYERAEQLCQESLELRRALGNKQGIGESLKTLGELAYYNAQYARATDLCQEALRLFREVDVRESIVEAVERLAAIRAAEQGAVSAAEWLGAAEARRAAIGIPLRPTDAALLARARADAQRILDEHTFAAAWQRGASAPWDDVVNSVSTSP